MMRLFVFPLNIYESVLYLEWREKFDLNIGSLVESCRVQSIQVQMCYFVQANYIFTLYLLMVLLSPLPLDTQHEVKGGTTFPSA